MCIKMLKRSIYVKSHGALVSFVNRLDVGEVDKIGVLLLLKTKLKETNLVLFKRWPENILLHVVAAPQYIVFLSLCRSRSFVRFSGKNSDFVAI